MKSFETPAGKVIQFKYKEGTSLIKVEFSTGGELPDELSGLFTSEREYEIAVLKYLDRIKKKSKTQ